MPWVYLSKHGDDQYINWLAASDGQRAINIDDWNYDSSSDPIVLRGIMKHKIMKRCWDESRPFRYMDTGYFGNQPSRDNPQGWKVWHRIVDNDLQHDAIVRRPDDRWRQFDLPLRPWKKSGRKILIAAPDEKPCKFYDVDLGTWIKQVTDEIKKHTDRPVVVRERAANRQVRVANDLKSALDDDVFALVTFNSIAATESVMHGIPAFVLAPSNAARPVANLCLDRIDNPWYPDPELVRAWACHLAYGQFHNRELKDGTALRILADTPNQEKINV